MGDNDVNNLKLSDEKKNQWSTKRSSHLDLLCYSPVA